MTTLDFGELKECVARCGSQKYKPVRSMGLAACVRGMIQNVLGEQTEEEVMGSNTLIRAARFDWKRGSRLLPGQSLKEHKAWLETWQRIEINDVYYFPLWEKGVHDLLQRHFIELRAIFLAYCRSCLLYTSPSPRDRTRSRMPSSA